jgi:hypothetical protein
MHHVFAIHPVRSAGLGRGPRARRALAAWLTAPRVRALLVLASAAAVGAMTLPPGPFTGHPSWSRIQWIPFLDPSGGMIDDVENVILFLPFGFSLACHWRLRSFVIGRVLVCAAALSACGEFYQVFCPNRYPSVTDVLNNTLGAMIGALAAGALGLLR